MIITITGMKHHEVQSISDCMVPKNVVQVERDSQLDKKPQDGCDGLAYKCTCKGVLIGYIPLLRTLRKYYKDSTTEAQLVKNRRRGIATKAVRNQLLIDSDNLCTELWQAKVVTLLYAKHGKFVEFPDWSDLCQMGEQGGWELCEVGINFDNVEEF